MIRLTGMSPDMSRCVADHLAILTDQIGEVLASMHDENRGPREHLMDAWLSVWKLRWELGLVGGRVIADNEVEPQRGSEAAE